MKNFPTMSVPEAKAIINKVMSSKRKMNKSDPEWRFIVYSACGIDPNLQKAVQKIHKEISQHTFLPKYSLKQNYLSLNRHKV